MQSRSALTSSPHSGSTRVMTQPWPNMCVAGLCSGSTFCITLRLTPSSPLTRFPEEQDRCGVYATWSRLRPLPMSRDDGPTDATEPKSEPDPLQLPPRTDRGPGGPDLEGEGLERTGTTG